MNHPRILAFSLFLALGTSAHARADLMAAWRAALVHDPEYAAAQADYSAGLQKTRQARALWRPSVSLGAKLGWASQTSNTSGASFSAPGFGSANDVAFRTNISDGMAQGWGLQLQQPLISGERSAAALALDLQSQMAELQWRAAQQALILRVAQAHFDLLAARQSLKSALAEQAATQSALGQAQESFKSGAVPVTGVYEARARSDVINAQVLAAQDSLTMAQTAYTDLTGLPAQEAADLPEHATMDTAPEPLESWLQREQAQSPALLMSQVAVKLARADTRAHRAQSALSLDLVARAGEDRVQGNSPYTTGTARYNTSGQWVGLQLSVPLYTGGMRSAQLDESAALAEKAQAQSLSLGLDLARQTRAAWLAVSTGLAQMQAFEQARVSAAKRLDATKTGLEVGERTELDLLNAQQDLHASELAWQQARHQVILGRLRLAALAGALDEDMLRRANFSFTP